MCYIRNHGNYYSRAEEEVFSNYPRIPLFHDVINGNEANKIKEKLLQEFLLSRTYVLYCSLVGDSEGFEQRPNMAVGVSSLGTRAAKL